jgi:hypothetical protein
VVVYAEAMSKDPELRNLLRAVDFPTILVNRSRDGVVPPDFETHTWVAVPDVHMTRSGQVKAALLVCLARGVLRRGDRVVCLTGVDGAQAIDALLVLDLGTESELLSLLDPTPFGSDVAPASSSAR